jgi:hypothetical protein
MNDFLLKEIYGNWVTGKLSDFAGLFIFPLFWTALLPNRKNEIFFSTALFFLYWKSPYSQSMIDNWNNLGLLHIVRIVDYSDLIALIALPFGYIIENQKDKLVGIKISPIVPITVSAFAFAATSKGGPKPEVQYFESYLIQNSQENIIERLELSGHDKCLDSKNSNLPHHKYCRVSVNNDTIRYIDIDVFQTNEGFTEIELNQIKYNEDVLGEADGEKLDSSKKELLKKIFEREVLNKIIKNTP